MQNKIILELVEFQSPKEFPKLLGYATVHLYEVIQVGIAKTRLQVVCIAHGFGITIQINTHCCIY